jgi:hypothetical protein
MRTTRTEEACDGAEKPIATMLATMATVSPAAASPRPAERRSQHRQVGGAVPPLVPSLSPR